MDKDKKNRSGSQSNAHPGSKHADARKNAQPGAPAGANREHAERHKEDGASERNITSGRKKNPNSI